MYVVGVGQVCYHDVHIHSAIATLAAAAAATLTANQPRICPRMMASLFEIVHDCFRTHCHQYAKHTEKHMVFVCIWFLANRLVAHVKMLCEPEHCDLRCQLFIIAVVSCLPAG